MSKDTQEERMAKLLELKKQREAGNTIKPTHAPTPKEDVDELAVAAEKTKQAVGVASKAMGEAGSKFYAAAKAKAEEGKRLLDEKLEANRLKKMQDQRQKELEATLVQKVEDKTPSPSQSPAYVPDPSPSAGFVDEAHSGAGYQEALEVVGEPASALKPNAMSNLSKDKLKLIGAVFAGVLALSIGGWFVLSPKDVAIDVEEVVQVADEPVTAEEPQVETVEEPVPELPVVAVSDAASAADAAVDVVVPPVVIEPDEAKPEQEVKPVAAQKPAPQRAARRQEQRQREEPKPAQPTWQDDANKELDRLENLLN